MEAKKTSDDSFTTSQQEIWKTRIISELSSAKEWEANWGFLIENRQAPSPEEEKSIVKDQISQSHSLSEARLVCPS
jgi:hypothetical protein